MRIHVLAAALLPFLLFFACTQGGYNSEGSPTDPVLLAVGSPHQGTIAGESASYYTFLAAGNGSHTIALTNVRSDLSWHLFDNTFVMIDECDIFLSADDEIASTVALTSGLSYYLMVIEWDNKDGTYILSITYP